MYPRNVKKITKFMLNGGVEAFLSTTGIERRYKANDNVCSSDLCIAAAEQLINELHWDKSDIDAVVFVSQTPDYKRHTRPLCAPTPAADSPPKTQTSANNTVQYSAIEIW